MLSIRLAAALAVPAFVMTLSATPGRRATAPDDARQRRTTSERSLVLADNLLVTWYGNPHSNRMGILGERKGADLAAGLREQAAAYEKVTTRKVLMAYHLVAVVAQGAPGADGKYRRRESTSVMRSLLEEARANGFKMIVDIQPGWSTVAEEVAALRPMLAEPDVYLALDPEFSMIDDRERAELIRAAARARAEAAPPTKSGVTEKAAPELPPGGSRPIPGKLIGTMRASDVNGALDELDRIITEGHLPPKVLIVHQFTWNMLPDKQNIRRSSLVDVVLDMDGFGDRSLKLSTYRAILRQAPMESTGFTFTGVKLFYKQDRNLFTPAQVVGLTPAPAVIIYQ